jgi:antitoxin MazE
MKVQVGRWGNSLAVRLPKAFVERFGINEGRELDLAALEAALQSERDGEAERQRKREEALERIRNTRLALPPDWKFDREEANWRPAMDRW